MNNVDIAGNLKRLAGKRADIFGEQEGGEQEEAVKNKVFYDGQSAGLTKTSANLAMIRE